MALSNDEYEVFNKNFHDELMSAVELNPNVVFSVDGSTNDDIISTGRKSIQNFVYFLNYGPNGVSLLEGDKDNQWTTTPNPDENSFTILFPHHSIRLIKFQIHTCENNEPDQFCMLGYNSRVKRWDVISDFQGKRLNPKSLYSFNVREVNQKILYRIFRFVSLSGHITLAYIKLYGDVVEEKDDSPETVAKTGNTLISYKNIPAFVCEKRENEFTEGIFRTATKIFGPELECFVTVTYKSEESSRFYDLWDARDKNYTSLNSEKPIFVCFYFTCHEIFIDGYQIRPSQKNSIKSWCIIGCQNNDDEGLVLDHQNMLSLENESSFYSWKTKDEYKDKSFRIIRFVGLDSSFSLKCLDFFGRAKPCPSKILTDKDIDGTFTFSHSITEWNHEK